MCAGWFGYYTSVAMNNHLRYQDEASWHAQHSPRSLTSRTTAEAVLAFPSPRPAAPRGTYLRSTQAEARGRHKGGFDELGAAHDVLVCSAGRVSEHAPSFQSHAIRAQPPRVDHPASLLPMDHTIYKGGTVHTTGPQYTDSPNKAHREYNPIQHHYPDHHLGAGAPAAPQPSAQKQREVNQRTGYVSVTGGGYVPPSGFTGENAKSAMHHPKTVIPIKMPSDHMHHSYRSPLR